MFYMIGAENSDWERSPKWIRVASDTIDELIEKSKYRIYR